MSEIQVLSQDVIEKIAAGEVIDRPSSIFKELIENSLDAGATELDIDFDQGGRDLKVKDNGKGMGETDLPLSVQRHATSKILTEKDLWQLGSYGFRGEALSSIGAVSDLSIVSKGNQSQQAYQMQVSCGMPKTLKKTSGEVGTTVHVHNLFENVPARLKFLKSEGSEASSIKKTLLALGLSHPDIQFRIRQKGKLLSFWPNQQSLLERAKLLLSGFDLFETREEVQGFDVHMVFSKPDKNQKRSHNLWFFVEDRWVQDKTMHAAVNEAYRSLMMHGTYPTVVVKLKSLGDAVDVNIHPSKAQVKFENPHKVFKAVHHVLRSALESAPWAPHVEKTNVAVPENFVDTPKEQENLKFEDQTYSKIQFKSKNEPFESITVDDLKRVQEIKGPGEDRPAPMGSYWSILDVVGQVNQTYIVAQSQKSMVIIDQHAAHERIAYERLMSAWRGQKMEIQSFLIPLSLDMDTDSIDELVKRKAELKKLGVQVDRTGPENLVVESAPAIIKERALKCGLEKMATECLERGGSFIIEKSISDICATLACHSVIRAGQTLGISEMKALLSEMDEFPLSGYCPHGRPVFIEKDFRQMDREFGRIV